MFKSSLPFLRLIVSSARDLAPIVVVIIFFQTLVLRQPFPDLAPTLVGMALVLVGLTLFVHGLETGLFPVGEGMAHALARKGSGFWLLCFAFALGFGTTIAEPALIAVAGKAAAASAEAGVIAGDGGTMNRFALGLRLSVAVSVGVALLLGVLRIVRNWPIHWMIIVGYGFVLAITPFAPESIVGVAYDSGGVTTGTVTVPLVTALGVGLASMIKGRNPMIDGFGLIALASLTPIVFVMIFGMVWAAVAG